MRLLSSLCQKKALNQVSRFVPLSKPVHQNDVSTLQDFMNNAKKLFVITGAGLSTESGIPDYRSEKVGLYARTNHRPMQYLEYIRSATGRQRYWARNFVGWPSFSAHQPNICHKTLSEWETHGKLEWLVTQNVDSLHTKAGSQNITELHGCSHRVFCLSCHSMVPRDELQTIFEAYNPEWSVDKIITEQIAPDGDVMLSDEQVHSFKVPDCMKCGGVLMPDVTFFGDNVPRSKVDFVFNRLADCDSVLVAGSSLYVYSGYRFVRQAVDDGKNIAIVNIGPTRADDLVEIKVEARCGDILPQITLD